MPKISGDIDKKACSASKSYNSYTDESRYVKISVSSSIGALSKYLFK